MLLPGPRSQPRLSSFSAPLTGILRFMTQNLDQLINSVIPHLVVTRIELVRSDISWRHGTAKFHHGIKGTQFFILFLIGLM
jgi:hypothetical protein